MGWPGGKSKEKKEADEEYRRAMALTEQGKPQGPTADDYVYSLGGRVYMIIDPTVTEFITPTDKKGNPKKSRYSPMAPAFSYLCRMTKYGKVNAEILELRYSAMIRICKMNSNEDEYDNEDQIGAEALTILSTSVISDSVDGWKAEKYVDQSKTIRTEMVEPKKKRWWG